MGQVVHRDRELKALRRPARFTGAAVLKAGVHQEAVNRLLGRQEVFCAALDAGEITQIADRRCQPAVQVLARDLSQHLVQTIGCGGIAAEDSEAMAGLQQLNRRLKTDAGASTSEQHVPQRSGGVACPSLVITVSSHGVRLFPKARLGRDFILLVVSGSGARAGSTRLAARRRWPFSIRNRRWLPLRSCRLPSPPLRFSLQSLRASSRMSSSRFFNSGTG